MSERCNATYHPPTFTAPVTPPATCDREAGHPGAHWEIVPGVGRRWNDNANGAAPHQPASSLADEVTMADDPEVELRRDYVARIDELERELRVTREVNVNLTLATGRLREERNLAIAQRQEARDELTKANQARADMTNYAESMRRGIEQAREILRDALPF